MKLPRTSVKVDYTKFKGGLDLESPPLSISPGALLAGMNYMCASEGGYERIDGYERFSGKASPSDATYYYCPCTFTGGGPAVGDTVTGADSGKAGTVIVVGSDYIDVTAITGAFNDDEVYTVGGNPKGTFTAAKTEKGESTTLLSDTALNLAADVYRALIAEPTSSGAVRGLVLLSGILYCFIDNAGGTAGLIYKATTAGWVAVTPGSEISFESGTGEISDGDTIIQLVSGATAPVTRVVLETGTWAAGTAAGRLILGTITGTFDATNALQVGGVTKATSASLATTITLLPGGRYEFYVYNFTGSTATRRIYGCDGKNRGFEFDGTVFVPIDTGMVSDIPAHVACYKSQLFFSFKGSSQNSGVGTPYQWTAVLGASEIALGDDIVGYSIESETLLILSRNSSNQLSGDNIDTFALDPISDEVGAIPWTIQNIIKPLWLDDRGLILSTRAQEYGNFNLSDVSGKIQPRINDMRAVVVASSVYKEKNQYRLYGSDGTGICCTIGSGRNGIEFYYTQFRYPDNVACVATGEDSNGKDIIFFGSDAGMVYQADKGSSFDGEDIEAFAFLAFNNSKSPSALKSYRKATIEMEATGYSSLRLSSMFSYGNTEIQTSAAVNLVDEEIYGTGGYWDLVDWGDFYYDSQIVGNPSVQLAGDGINISIGVYSKSDKDRGHKISSVVIHYSPRRLVR